MPRHIAHAADVVHAHGEGVVAAAKRLRESSRARVPFEHEHLAAAPGERRRGREAADARADDDHVIAFHRPIVAVRARRLLRNVKPSYCMYEVGCAP